MPKKPDFDDCLEVLVPEPQDETNPLEALMGDDDVENSTRWQDHWKGMPHFEQEEAKPYKKLNVCFKTKEDFEAFRELVKCTMTDKTKTIWYPPFDREANSLYAWIDE
jgi:hypothetical protein